MGLLLVPFVKVYGNGKVVPTLGTWESVSRLQRQVPALLPQGLKSTLQGQPRQGEAQLRPSGALCLGAAKQSKGLVHSGL